LSGKLRKLSAFITKKIRGLKILEFLLEDLATLNKQPASDDQEAFDYFSLRSKKSVTKKGRG